MEHNAIKRRLGLLIISCLILLTGCEPQTNPGFLQVSSLTKGQFEIYRFEKGESRSLVSEQSGDFNQKIPLPPGSYLVLADCSSETVIIYPGQTKFLTAHEVLFEPPFSPQPGDSFSIQCSRSHDIRSRQQFSNRYRFNLFHGKRDLLVSLVPFQIDFTKLEQPLEPKSLSYNLSAVQVGKFEGIKRPSSFFVSPQNQLVSVTKSLPLGNWEFLLPGKYTLELNGTKLPVEIPTDSSKVIQPASIKVTTADDTDLSQSAEITGAPQLVEINSGHWLNFNETYPILPGPSILQIKGSSRRIAFEVAENETKVFKTKSVTVNQGCSPWEWTCLGQRDVMLYEDGSAYPFVENVTDIPVLYIDDGTTIWVGVGGSRDIRYKLPEKKKTKKLHVGYVNLIPVPETKTGQRTDLLRVETTGQPFEGVSLDLNLERPTRMPLIAGWYYLSHYVSLAKAEGDRRRTKRGFRVVAGETIDLEFKVYFSEKKLQSYISRGFAREAERHRASYRHPFSRPHRAL